MEILGAVGGGIAAAGAALLAILRNPQKRARIVGSAASALTGGAVTSVDSMRSTVDALKMAVDSLTSTVESQGRSLKAAETRVTQLEERLIERDEKISELRRELTQTKRQLTMERNASKKLKETVDKLVTQLEGLGKEPEL